MLILFPPTALQVQSDCLVITIGPPMDREARTLLRSRNSGCLRMFKYIHTRGPLGEFSIRLDWGVNKLWFQTTTDCKLALVATANYLRANCRSNRSINLLAGSCLQSMYLPVVVAQPQINTTTTTKAHN